MLLSLTTARGPVSYSRNKNHYNTTARYRSKIFTYAKVTQAADYIAGQGLALHHKVQPGHMGWQSSLTATPETVERVSAILNKGTNLEALPPPEIIILRDADGRSTDYRESCEIRKMRLKLAAMNEAIRATMFTGIIPDAMVRIFNKSFNRGGRFYALGGSWQSMSKDARKQIRIGGEPVVEIDYKTLHPALLYAQAGAQMPEDCYSMNGWPRSLVKVAFLILINAKKEHDARAAIARHDQMALLTRPGSQEAFSLASDLTAAIKARHVGIAPAFHSDKGAELMRLDSDLAETVMHVMMMAGVVVLPVHDSFLVQESKAGMLEEVMLRVAYEAGYESLRVQHA
ncbi:hypothetical protein ASD01_29705 [Ensifer sp. Root423]|uniref:hypothetical protein n=1 Tax=Ensifer sp. Root423 TaxID=1736534 RepID=UPI000712ED59|nr:hypothetical protein [Ensifer sp. Root423]KQX20991.1 hypothetical protein ASD01_29705 [Ensifer sp. Root423]